MPTQYEHGQVEGVRADHTIKTVTKVTTRMWPPDSYFQEAQEKSVADFEAMKQESLAQRQQILDSFPQSSSLTRDKVSSSMTRDMVSPRQPAMPTQTAVPQPPAYMQPYLQPQMVPQMLTPRQIPMTQQMPQQMPSPQQMPLPHQAPPPAAPKQSPMASKQPRQPTAMSESAFYALQQAMMSEAHGSSQETNNRAPPQQPYMAQPYGHSAGADTEASRVMRTKVTTRKWPPDDWYPTGSVPQPVDRAPQQQYYGDHEPEMEQPTPRAMRTKVTTRKWPPDNWFPEGYTAPPQRAPTAGPDYYNQQMYGGYSEDGHEDSVSRRSDTSEPTKLRTRVTTRKWPPDTYFRDQRGAPEAAAPRCASLAPTAGSSTAGLPVNDGRPIIIMEPTPEAAERGRLLAEKEAAVAAAQAQAEADEEDRLIYEAAAEKAREEEAAWYANLPPPPAPPPLPEPGEHFHCLGCGCHVKPSEVIYRPRRVPRIQAPPSDQGPSREPSFTRVPSMARVPSMHPVASMREPAMPAYLPLPPEPPREELAVKDVENFDFEGARKPEYGIKTVENFDFDAARRSAEQADDNRVKAVENFDFAGARQAADDNRVKAVENFDFEAARQAGAQQDDNRVKAVENFDFEAARAAGAAAANQGRPEYGIKTVEDFDFEEARRKIANAAAGGTNTQAPRR